MRRPDVAMVVLLTVSSLLPAGADAAGESVAFIRSAQGAGVVRRAGQDLVAREGLVLVEGDVVRTQSDGRLGLLFQDDTRVGLGPDSEMQIVRFRFQPTRDDLRLLLRIVRGVVSYASGKVAALAPANVRVETPTGVVGLRGTAFAVRVEGD